MKNITKYLFSIKLRLFLFLVLFASVAWILYMGLVPSGKIVYSHDFKDTNEFIGRLTPKERIDITDNDVKTIIGEPVYFSLRTPRSFDKGKLKIKYKNINNLPIIEAGVLVDKTIWRYDLQPVANRTLDQLSYVWDKTRNNDLLFLQREKRYKGIDDFLANLPERNRIALYNYNIQSEFIIKNYKKSKELNVIDYPIRGSYEFYTYIKDEDLDFKFTFLDINENNDADQFDLHLYYENELLDAQHMNDDGVVIDSGEKKVERTMTLELAGLPEGVYKLELRANDDIITKRIETKQQKIAFVNKLWLANNSDFDISLFTDSKKLAVKTDNPESLQTIKVASSTLEIKETYKQFETIIKSASSTNFIHKIILAKDGVILAGNGVFGFSLKALVNPNFKKVNELLDVNNDGVDYILAKYIEPNREGDYEVAEVDFDLKQAYRENYKVPFGCKYSFLLSIPGLKLEKENKSGLEIDSISIELEGKSLWEKVKENL